MKSFNDVRLATDPERHRAIDDAERVVHFLGGLGTKEASNALIVAMAIITMYRFGKRGDRVLREAWVEDLATAAKKTMMAYEGVME